MSILALDPSLTATNPVRINMPSGRNGAFIGLRIRRECEACKSEFFAYPSEVRQLLEAGKIGPRFCSLDCYNTTRTGPKCVKCGGPNTRGQRKRVCQDCLQISPVALKRAKGELRIAECPPGKRWCNRCDEFLPPAQFSTHDNICTACNRTRATTGHLRRSYGITPEEYQAILVAQDGKCAICHRSPRKRPLSVDHDHSTGAVRGLLCSWCNHRLLPGARDSIEVLMRAIDYLRTPPAEQAIGRRLSPIVKSKARKPVTK